MRKNIKFFIICAIVAATGFVLTGMGIAMGGIVYGFGINAEGIKVYAPRLEQKNKESETTMCRLDEQSLQAFDRMEIDVEYADIRVERTDSEQYTLSCNLSDEGRLQNEVKDGKLIVRHKDNAAFGTGYADFMWFSVGNNSSVIKEYITIGLPKQADLTDVCLDTDSGDITCENINTDSLSVRAEYGDVSLANIEAKEMEIHLESGEMQMEQVSGNTCSVESEYGKAAFRQVALSGDLLVTMESGNLEFYNTDARNLDLKNQYGTVSGRQTSFADISMNLESGDCQMQDILFDNCEIHSEYGDVELELQKDRREYAYALDTEYGNIKIDGQKMEDTYVSLAENQEHLIEIHCESGDIRIQ